MNKLFKIIILIVFAISFTGCSRGNVANQTEYDTLQAKLDDANASNDDLQKKNTELQSQVTELQKQLSELTDKNNTLKEQLTPIPTPKPEAGEYTSKELETILSEQPMSVVSTDYLVQSDDYKGLYPDMLNAVINNNSGTDVKNAKVAFVAWDKNKFPVKIKSQFDFSDGSYVNEVDYGDVNMVDGTTYGEGMGMSLDSETDNIKYIKAIIFEYTSFNGDIWKNPYYSSWKELYENKKLEN